MSKISVFCYHVVNGVLGVCTSLPAFRFASNRLVSCRSQRKKPTVLANESFEFQLIDVKTNRVVFSGKQVRFVAGRR
jgi:hypothetical protein